jgi:hypothetical protein
MQGALPAERLRRQGSKVFFTNLSKSYRPQELIPLPFFRIKNYI